MKKFKRVIAGILAATVLMAGAAFAADTKTVSINGTEIEGAQALTSDGKTFVPVRAICEGLGMQVEWDGENEIITLVKLPIYITFSPNADGYTFAKTAPMLLGSAPIMKNDRTYVPENFVTEILNGEVEISEEGNVNIVVEVDNTVPVEILEVKEGDQGMVLSVNDLNRGEEVVVNITDETVIVDDNGEAAAIETLVKGMDAKIEYAQFMTMSIPPMTNAVKIVVPAPFRVEEEVETEETAVSVAEVVEVSAEEDATVITVNDEVRGEVVVNITAETVITDAEGNAAKAEDIEKGAKLEITYADFMTMSLPPITNAVAIVIL